MAEMLKLKIRTDTACESQPPFLEVGTGWKWRFRFLERLWLGLEKCAYFATASDIILLTLLRSTEFRAEKGFFSLTENV
jgi:hypothetical protein